MDPILRKFEEFSSKKVLTPTKRTISGRENSSMKKGAPIYDEENHE